MKNSEILCDASDSVLIVVDIQPTLAAAMPEDDAEQMIANTRALIQAARALEIPVLVTEQYPAGLGETSEELLAVLDSSCNRYAKTGFSCLAADGLADVIKSSGRQQVILAGQEAHVCVLQTAVDLQRHDYTVFVAEDAVCSRKQEHRFFALERMRDNDIVISNYESVIFEWLRDAAHPQFKNISGLIR